MTAFTSFSFVLPHKHTHTRTPHRTNIKSGLRDASITYCMCVFAIVDCVFVDITFVVIFPISSEFILVINLSFYFVDQMWVREIWFLISGSREFSDFSVKSRMSSRAAPANPGGFPLKNLFGSFCWSVTITEKINWQSIYNRLQIHNELGSWFHLHSKYSKNSNSDNLL